MKSTARGHSPKQQPKSYQTHCELIKGSKDEAKRAIGFAKKAKADDLLADASLAWGNALSRNGDFDEAKEKLELAIKHAEIANLPLIAGQSYQILGIDSVYQGEHEAAKRYFEKNLEIFRQLKHRQGEAAGLGNLGVLMLIQCNYPAALVYIEQTAEIFHEVNDIRNETIGLINIGSVALKLGQFEKAQKNYEQGLKLALQTADLQSQREAHNWLGHLFSDLAQYAKAGQHYRDGLILANKLNTQGHVVELQVGLATLAWVDGNHEEAAFLLNEVLHNVNEQVLAQADDMLRIFLRAYQILKGGRDERAQAILETANNHLQKLAAQINNTELKRYFLQDVAIHRAITAEFEKS
ncbi:MAG: tetratricopeptide (TPR) repeat protein [Cellvibrionaceae bacterium]|jgi:tetratricopeptide (TPR) repeat protein